MEKIIIFIISFIVVYLVYYILIIKNEEKVKKMLKSTETNYLKKVYKLNINKYDSKWLVKKIVLTNTLIMSITITIVSYIENMIVMILVGFVCLFPVILISYHILGKYLQSKGNKKKGDKNGI